MNPILLNNAIAVAAIMFLLWLISIPLRDVSIIDLVWGPGFAVIGWVTYASHSPDSRHLMLPVLVTIWALRLGLHLAWRNHGKPEDYRYQAMRKRHGNSFAIISLFTVFALQGVVMWIVSLPIQTTGSMTPANSFSLVAGTILWLTGLIFEAVGDWQLAVFRANPENSGKVLHHGLWRLSRHPNYFGDFCVWWGHFLIALTYGAAWWSVIGPVLMSIFLMKYSGVGLLEKSLKSSKPDYVEYMSTTNAFFPWFRRSAVQRSTTP